MGAEPGRGAGKHGGCLGCSEDGGAATNRNIFNIGKFLTLWNIFCDTSSHRRKTDGQILSLNSCSSRSEYDIAKTIALNDVIKFASVKVRNVTL
jgi:hypothetical protein